MKSDFRLIDLLLVPFYLLAHAAIVLFGLFLMLFYWLDGLTWDDPDDTYLREWDSLHG